MYEKVTANARKVFALSHVKAREYYHEYVGTEHLLLALLDVADTNAAKLLTGTFEVDLDNIRLEVEKLIKAGPEMEYPKDKLPQTPRAKKVVELAMEEAAALGYEYVGTEHILLGMLRESEGVAGQVLLNGGLRFHEVRDKVGESGEVLVLSDVDRAVVMNVLGTILRRSGLQETDLWALVALLERSATVCESFVQLVKLASDLKEYIPQQPNT